MRLWLATCCVIGISSVPVHAQVREQDSFGDKKQITVFCTSNRDTTGVCIDPVTDAPLDCIATPGEVVPCKRSDGSIYQCQWLSSTPLQIELSCTADAHSQSAPISTDLFQGSTPESQLSAPDQRVSDNDGVPNASGLQDPAPSEQVQQPISASEFAETFTPEPLAVDSSADLEASSANQKNQLTPKAVDQSAESTQDQVDGVRDDQPFTDPFLQDFFSRPE